MVLSNEDLRKVQLLQLKILKEVHRICEKHSIKYFLIGGTLLGAIRHKGFIPWDDDIDIGMLREEYERFCSICRTDLSNEYFLQTIETDPGYALQYGKMMLMGTTLIEKSTGRSIKKSGLFIDIFPYDYIPRKRYKQYILFFLSKILLRAYALKKGYRIMWNNSICTFFLNLISVIFCIFPSSVLYSLLRYAITMYQNPIEGKEVLVGVVGSNFLKRQFKNDNLKDLILLLFEDDLYFAPKNYDIILSKIYGDYMTMPPLEKRCSNHQIIEYKL